MVAIVLHFGFIHFRFAMTTRTACAASLSSSSSSARNPYIPQPGEDKRFDFNKFSTSSSSDELSRKLILDSDLQTFVDTYNSNLSRKLKEELHRVFNVNVTPSTTTNGTTSEPEAKSGFGISPAVEPLTKDSSSSSSQLPLYRPDKLDFCSIGIGGLQDKLRQLFRTAFSALLLSPEKRREYDYYPSRGVLFFGPPGTGKTTIAKNICKFIHVKPTIVKASEILLPLVGATERAIEKLVQNARTEFAQKGANSSFHVFVFDEIDALLPKRKATSHEHTAQMVNCFLTLLDGPNSVPNVMFIGTTNRKDLIDPAFLRPGRFEIQMEIGMPDEKARLEILEIHTKEIRIHFDTSVDLRQLAKETKGFSGADLVGLVRKAKGIAVERSVCESASQENTCQDITFSMDDFLKAFSEVCEQKTDDCIA